LALSSSQLAGIEPGCRVARRCRRMTADPSSGANECSYMERTSVYHPEVAADAWGEVSRFFAVHLKGAV
jgi:hypothetical protein